MPWSPTIKCTSGKELRRRDSMMDFIIKYWVEFLLTGVTGGIVYVFKQYIGLKQGMQALLRNEIVRIYDTHMKLGYCSSFMKENVKDMYESYHMLKGNGLVTSMVNQLYDLPTEPRKGEQG